MPELPELEALRETILEDRRGHPVTSMAVRQFALVKTYQPSPEDLLGQAFTGTGRHGKHLLFHFGDELTLAIHLGIGGRIVVGKGGRVPPRSVSMELGFADGSLLRIVELGTKKRSSVHVLARAQVPAHLSSLGPDALDPELTPSVVGSLLKVERGQLKHLLENQHRIAGIGNAYSDEILWEARLAPLRLTDTLMDEDVARLHAAINEVFTAAIDRARVDNYLLLAKGDERGTFSVHRREGQPCPRCGGAIASIHFADNSLQYCPTCQAGGRHYADRRLSRLLR